MILRRVIILATFTLLIALIVWQGMKNETKNSKNYQHEEVIVIDGCEYLKIPSYMQHHTLTHKGNCKNPIHYQF